MADVSATSDTKTTRKDMSVIIIGGSPGCGKTTLGEALKGVLKGPWIDYGRLRDFHLQNLETWSDANDTEESLTAENLVWITRNYLKHGYHNILIDDLQDERILCLASVFEDLSDRLQIFTLYLSDNNELCRRITTRNSGWKNTQRAVEWNELVMQRATLKQEHKIDVSQLTPKEVLDRVLQILDAL